ncbi:Cytochrome P450 monooxygenase apf7 [Paramyrothecium foliicola]|nr:Cytochrome P450 monooxygenase apf7 [Paramyrothecium foliicola]
MAFFPRTIYNNEASLAPLFRLLDDFDKHTRSSGQSNGNTSIASAWQPRFDVRETADAYELHGELPGVRKNEISIEFPEPQVMVVHGRTERTYTAGTPPAGHLEDSSRAAITEGSERRNSHQATVEDENEAATNSGVVAKQNADKKAEQPADKAKYWLKERSVGEFTRTFNFPTRVNQEAVSASLTDGILSVTVPKVTKHESKHAYGGWLAMRKNQHIAIHQSFLKYGPVVRQAPNRLVFNTIQALHDIYPNSKVNKGQAYVASQLRGSVPSIFGTLDRLQHRKKRRLMSEALSDGGIRLFEHSMRAQIDVFLQKILDASKESVPVDMSPICQRLAIDVIGLLAFGFSLKTQTEEAYQFLQPAIDNAAWRINTYMQMPSLAPIEGILLTLGKRQFTEFSNAVQHMIQTRIAKPKDSQHDLYKVLADHIGSDLDGIEEGEVWSEAMFFIMAGGTTVSTAMSATFFYLSRNPEAYHTLVTEIRSTFENDGQICSGAKLNSCKYLRACIDETLRMSPPTISTLWREQDSSVTQPNEPFVVDGYHIPRNTQVGVNLYALFHNEDYFPDSFTWQPERWLCPDDETHDPMRKAFVPFILGDRSCAGRTMAYLEASLTLARTLWYFDFRRAPGELGDVGGYHPVDCGDIFNNRYEVVRKLGYGSSATIWLAVDNETDKYVALKIFKSRFVESEEQLVSTHQKLRDAGAFDGDTTCLEAKDIFVHYGVNGLHLCMVTEPMGPPLYGSLCYSMMEVLSRHRSDAKRLPMSLLKPALRDILAALKSLHANNILHGNLGPNKILVNLLPMSTQITRPETLRHRKRSFNDLRRLDGREDFWAPPALAEGRCLDRWISPDLRPLVRVADIGGPYFEPALASLPRLFTGFSPPEAILGVQQPTMASDIWAFGWIFYQYLTGAPLVYAGFYDQEDSYYHKARDEHIIKLCHAVGPLPPFLFQLWERGRFYLAPDGVTLLSQASDRASVSACERQAVRDLEQNMARLMPSGANDVGIHGAGNNSPRDSATSPVIPTDLVDEEPFQSLEQKLKKRWPGPDAESEAKEVLDLLLRILSLDPGNRPSAAEILQHPWFRE